jgi:hypothetical protein
MPGFLYKLESGVKFMLKILIAFALLFSVLSFTTPGFAEGGITLHQVYLAAEAGKFSEAQSMMDKVLRDHPNSAKAHFVEAELLARQGQFSKAEAELNSAERLQPGLPFAKPEALQNLKNRIASASNGPARPNSNSVRQGMPVNPREWMPAILLIAGIALVIGLIGFMSRRNARMNPVNNYAGNMPGGSGAGPVMGQSAGSGIMGSLATGAAMGAGVVAGEALMHKFLDGDRHGNTNEPSLQDNSPWNTSDNNADDSGMGGADFGVDDASSWDDDSAGNGDDDWT